MTPVVYARGLTKRYGELAAVDSIDLDVRRGEIFGLIGPDGAGKTTAFKILAGVLEPSAGEVEVLGQRPREARSVVGYLTQPFSLYLDLSVEENLRYSAGLREVSEADYQERRRRYLRLVDLERFADRLAGKLSGGMKQKLALCCALLAQPALLLLDEPTSGVDPVSRRDFWDALLVLSTAGTTIVVATPYLDEAERCHRVALMMGGRIRQLDTPAGFRASLGMARLEVHSAQLERAEEALSGAAGIADVQRFGDRLDVMAADAAQAEAAVRTELAARQVPLAGLRRSSPTLENAFVTILRRDLGETPVPPFPAERPPAPSDGVGIGGYQLSKRFGDFQAVKDVTLEVRFGEIYGLVGANGAGKTTLIRMLCGLLEPSGGQVRLLGETGNLRSADLRSRIGYMSQKFSLYSELSVLENLQFYSGAYGVPARWRQARHQWVLEMAGLAENAGLAAGRLPAGWKQRLAFGAAIMHEPRVLFLDEPTSGVDPVARRAFWRLIHRLADQGVAILVTTHYLEEAEQCNRLGLMAAGELIAQGAPSEVKKLAPGRVLEIEADEPLRSAAALRARFGNRSVSLFGHRLHLALEQPEETPERVRALLADLRAGPRRVEEIEFSLEDVFISLVGR